MMISMAQLFGDVAYHGFEGITLFAEEKGRMLENLGDRHVLVLCNHGIAVCEQDVPRTFMRLWTAQPAAEIQCQAGMLQGPNIMLNDGVRTHCSNPRGRSGLGTIWVRRGRLDTFPCSRRDSVMKGPTMDMRIAERPRPRARVASQRAREGLAR